MSKTSIALFVMFLIALGALIATNTMYAPHPVLRSFPNVFPTKEVISVNTLSLSPQFITVSAGKTASIDVVINSTGDKPTVVQFELAYDPSSVTVRKITPGNFFSTPDVVLSKINERTGRISYALKTTKPSENQTGTSTVATIQFVPQLSAIKGQTNFRFLSKTVVQTSTSPNALNKTSDARITIINREASQATPSAAIIQ